MVEILSRSAMSDLRHHAHRRDEAQRPGIPLGADDYVTNHFAQLEASRRCCAVV
jgi:hypothetical protein